MALDFACFCSQSSGLTPVAIILDHKNIFFSQQAVQFFETKYHFHNRYDRRIPLWQSQTSLIFNRYVGSPSIRD